MLISVLFNFTDGKVLNALHYKVIFWFKDQDVA